MKRTLSWILVAAMLASLIAICPAFAAADDEKGTRTLVDFDSYDQSQFYADTTGKAGSFANGTLIQNSGDAAHKNYLQLPCVRYVFRNDTGAAYPSSVRLSDIQGKSPVNFETGTQMYIGADIKVQDLKFESGKDTSKLYLGLVFTADNCNGIGGSFWNKQYDAGLRKYYTEKKLIKVDKIDPSNSGWQNVGAIVTVPEHKDGEYPTLVVYSEATDGCWTNNSELFIDNIVAETYAPDEKNATLVDFDSYRQAKLYADTTGRSGSYANGRLIQDSGDAEHKNYLQLPCVRYVFRNDTGTAWPSSVRLSNTQGNGLVNYASGTILQVAADVKVQDLKFPTGMDTSKLYLGLVFTGDNCNEIGGGYWKGMPDDAGLRKYHRSGKLISVKKIDADTNEWQSVSGIVTVPEHEDGEYPTLVIYSEAKDGCWTNSSELFIDNIAVSEYDWNNTESTIVDFQSGAQADFYKDATGGNGAYANGQLVRDFDATHGNVMRLPKLSTTASNNYFTNFPSCVRISDTTGRKPLNFAMGATIQISADIKFGDVRRDNGDAIQNPDWSAVYLGLVFSGQPCSTVGGYVWDRSSPSGLYYHKANNSLLKLGKVDTENSDWQTVTGLISVPKHALNELPTLVLFTEKELWVNTDGDIYIDNIRITVEEYFDPDTVTPTSLITGFETDEYDEGVSPYTHKFDKQSDFCSADRTDDAVNTKNVGWITDSEAESSSGKGFLYIDNSKDKYTAKSEKSNAVALFNPDGSQYKVVAGVRYHVQYDLWLDANGYLGYPADEVIDLVTSYRIPSEGLEHSYITVQNHHVNKLMEGFNKYGDCEPGTRGRYNYYEGYFEATNTGNLYLTMYCQQGLAQEIKIDNLKIIPETEEPITRIRYMTESGQPFRTCLGKPGVRILDAGMVRKKDGQTFDGWYTQDGTLFSSLTFPTADIDLYPHYKALEPVPEEQALDWSQTYGSDFENTEELLKFYGSYNNMGTEPSCGVRLVNDPENAHSGSQFMGFMATGMWLDLGQNRHFKFYADGTPNNWIILEPHSSYKLTYYLKYMYFAGLYSKFTTVGFSLTEPDKVIRGYGSTEYLSADPLGEYQKIEEIINTGEERVALGLELYSGYVVAAVDDISVEKVSTVTVHFESEGGSSVEDIEMLAYGYATEPNYPTKDGYTFAGWYLDAGLTRAFSFVQDMIESDMTLYAKWEKIPEPPKEEKTYRTVYETKTVEETVEIPVTDPELDEAIVVNGSDTPTRKPGKGNTVKQQTDAKPAFPWIWVVIIAASTLILAGAVVTVILVRKHKKKLTGEE